MKILLLFILLLSNFTLAQVKPIKPWAPLVENVAGYNIYMGTSPTTLTLYKTVGKDVMSIDIVKLPPATYYIEVEAFNSQGVKSRRSPQIKYTVTNKRFIDVLMSVDGGLTYKSIGKVEYPTIKGQKYKTKIITEP